MKSRVGTLVAVGAAVALVAVLAGCGGPSSPAGSEATPAIKAELTSSRHAVSAVLDACAHNGAVQRRVEPRLRGASWDSVCKAVRDHRVSVVSDHVAVHGHDMTDQVNLRTAGSQPRFFDETWKFTYHHREGWELSTMPTMLRGNWDHDEHTWTEATVGAPMGSSTTAPHDSNVNRDPGGGDDDHNGTTPTTAHTGDDHGGTAPTTPHDADDHSGTDERHNGDTRDR